MLNTVVKGYNLCQILTSVSPLGRFFLSFCPNNHASTEENSSYWMQKTIKAERGFKYYYSKSANKLDNICSLGGSIGPLLHKILQLKKLKEPGENLLAKQCLHPIRLMYFGSWWGWVLKWYSPIRRFVLCRLDGRICLSNLIVTLHTLRKLTKELWLKMDFMYPY